MARKKATPAWVTRSLVEVAERCMEAVPHMSRDPVTKELVPDGTWTFNAQGAVSALEKLGRSMGMFTDRVSVTAGGVEEYLRGLPESGGGEEM